jgi:hypothetical protein
MILMSRPSANGWVSTEILFYFSALFSQRLPPPQPEDDIPKLEPSTPH